MQIVLLVITEAFLLLGFVVVSCPFLPFSENVVVRVAFPLLGGLPLSVLLPSLKLAAFLGSSRPWRTLLHNFPHKGLLALRRF